MGSHKKWRAEAKKMRRKRKRQQAAQERDESLKREQEKRENSPRYQVWLSEQRALELFAEEEEARLAAEQQAAYLAEEERAQKEWRERQERLALVRAERAKQEIRIKQEWEKEQEKVKAAKEEQERIAEEKQKKQEELLRQIENFINKGGDMPPEVNVASVTNPDRPPCPFFTKTGACRFGDRCSRNHTRPAVSRVLLVPNFYDHIRLRQTSSDELEGGDNWLEYEDSETYQHFLEFYEDVLPEWERFGRISQFKVCCNFELHLRGNVYIEYESARDAVQAFKLFHGRFYGGKQINVEFVTIDSWKAAICGQFHKNCCPKGRSCNFLHVFRNPRNAFDAADCDQQDWRRKKHKSRTPSPHRGRGRSWSGSPESTNSNRRRDWRWSASPSPPLERDRSGSVSSHRDQDSSADRKRERRRRERDERRDYGSERSRGKRRHKDSYNHGDHASGRRENDRKGDSSKRHRLEEQNGTRSSSKRARKVSISMYGEEDKLSEKCFNNGHQATRAERSEVDEHKHCLTSNVRNRIEHENTVVDATSQSPLDVIPLSKDNVVSDSNVMNESESNDNAVQIVKSKDRRSKKKKKGSNRKEKKRKKKSRHRSDSSNSSDCLANDSS